MLLSRQALTTHRPSSLASDQASVATNTLAAATNSVAIVLWTHEILIESKKVATSQREGGEVGLPHKL